MRKFVAQLAVASALVLSAASVHARPLSIGTNPQGSLAYLAGSAIADVVGDALDASFTVVPQGGPTAIIPAMAAGEFEFGFANIVAAATAVTGAGPFKGRTHESIRVAAVIYPLLMGVYVRDDSGIHTYADLKGRRLASAYKSQTNLAGFLKTALAMHGMSYADVQPIAVQNGVQAMDELIENSLDATIFGLDAGVAQKADAVVGVRILPVDDSEQARQTLAKLRPGAVVTRIKKGSAPGVDADIHAIQAAFVILTDRSVDADTVYRVVKALAENREKLAASDPAFKAFARDKMADSSLPVTYHEGAIKYYKEQGIWH